MRKQFFVILFLLLTCMSCSFFIIACDTMKTSQTSIKSSTESPKVAVSSTPGTLPTLVVDPGWKVVYKYTGDTTHLASQSFTAENSYIIIGTCLGSGSITVHIDPSESASIPCSQTAQPVTEDKSSSISGQARTVKVSVQGTKIQWTVLVATSKAADSYNYSIIEEEQNPLFVILFGP